VNRSGKGVEVEQVAVPFQFSIEQSLKEQNRMEWNGMEWNEMEWNGIGSVRLGL